MWLNVILICGFSGLIEYFILSFFFVFRPNTAKILQRIYNQNGVINSEENLPKSIKEKLRLYNEIEQKMENEEIKKDEIVINTEIKNKLEEGRKGGINEVNGDIKTDININEIENKELEKIKEEKEEDLKSEEVKLNDEEIKNEENINKGKDDNILKENPQLNKSDTSIRSNQANKSETSKEKEKEEEDIGENYADDFSEKMSQEGNIIYSSNNYFLEPWNLKSKTSIKKSK